MSEEFETILEKPKRGRPRKRLVIEPKIEPPQPIRPPKAFSVKQWKSNVLLQKMLSEVLEQPVFQMAKQTIMMVAMPGANPIITLAPGVTAEAMALADSQRYYHRSGMAQVFRVLENLATPEGDTSNPAQWGKLILEDE